MKKLRNTLYITDEHYYLKKEGETVAVYKDGTKIKAFPIHILDGIVCFTYLGCSPELIGLCNEHQVELAFLKPSGAFLGRFQGMTTGNVLLRRKQYRMADGDESLECAKNIIYAKGYNSQKVLKRGLKDSGERMNESQVLASIEGICNILENIPTINNKDSLRGCEGSIARFYFQSFDELILQQRKDFYFVGRNKRPPRDYVNALLSFVYALLTNSVQSALEAVGIDSYVGFFHTDRPGRPGMALDCVEELRHFMGDRFVLTMINKKIIQRVHFEEKENGAVLLNEKGRMKVLEHWQKRKQDIITHPFVDENIKIGLIPHVQAMLMNQYIRGDLESYPPFLIKG